MATEVVKRLINVEEYYKMAEVGILKPEDRVELIDGEIYRTSPIGSQHAAIIDYLAMKLNETFKHNAIVRVQNPLRIDDNNEPEPDITLIKYRADFYAAAHPVPNEVLAVVEVAGSSIRFDKDIKSLLYASCGIPEYWIINMNEDQLEVFSDPKGGNYAQNRLYGPADDVTLMGSKLAVKNLLLLT